jgi:hypothetical protein
VKFKFSQILLGDKNATSLCSKIISTLTSILKPLQMVKSCPIFDRAAKLGKASSDAFNPGLLLIL